MDSKPVFLKDFIAGWAGGIAQVLVGQPFDTIKVWLQASSSSPGVKLDLRKTIKAQGLSSLYRGTSVPLFGIGFSTSIQFSVMETMKRMMSTIPSSAQKHNLDSFQMALCGLIAGIANTVVSGPVEHIRIRMQTKKDNFSGVFDGIFKILQNRGVGGLFQGQVMTMFRDGIGFGAYFLAYETLIKRYLMSDPNKTRASIETWRLILYGGIAGLSFWSIAFPFDVLKTKVQSDSYILSERKYPSYSSVLKEILFTKGIRGFFNGFTPCFLRAFPVNAATFVIFEYSMRMLYLPSSLSMN